MSSQLRFIRPVLYLVPQLLMLFAATFAFGANFLAPSGIETGKLALTSGKSAIFRSEQVIKRVSIADPRIADFLLLSPREIYLKGAAAGTTNMTLWRDGMAAAVYDIDVSYDLSSLKRQFHEAFPQEKELRVYGANETITLSGRVSSASNLSHAISLARTYAPEEKINNLVEVGGVHQVMLEVRVAEMARSTTRDLGINFTKTRSDNLAIAALGILDNELPFFRIASSYNDWVAVVDALKEVGLAKILAEPTLISLSGQSASFLAGGEYPIPVPQGDDTITIEYKTYGVGLFFKPTVLSEDSINIQVTPDVSELDFNNAIVLEGFLVPAITTRRTSTTIELADGQSFAIAGLLQENIREKVSKFPFLGDVPVLGALFTSSAFQKNETELIIIVTPRLVKPLDVPGQSLPTDAYVEPNDLEFYLEGLLEGRGNPPAKSGKFDGPFGHSRPEDSGNGGMAY